MGKSSYPEPQKPEACVACGGSEFGEEEARLSSKWNASGFIVRLYICKACAHIMQYFVKKSNVSN